MGMEWDFHLGDDLNSRLTRLMDHHPEADLGQGHQSYQGHRGHRRHRPDHQDRHQEEAAEG